jgi:hypothetical protein
LNVSTVQRVKVVEVAGRGDVEERRVGWGSSFFHLGILFMRVAGPAARALPLQGRLHVDR